MTGRTIDKKLDLTSLVPDTSLYGGYYTDYLGAHEGCAATGKNLVKAAADENNESGTLTTSQIETLSAGGSVEIATGVGTEYDPAAKAGSDHITYWKGEKAFNSTDSKTVTNDWSGNRGSKDTEVLTTGGKGNNVTAARAAIYYIKEVPRSYLNARVHSVYYLNESNASDPLNNKITQLYWVTGVDDGNYETMGFDYDQGNAPTGTNPNAKLYKNLTYNQTKNGSVTQTIKHPFTDYFPGMSGYLAICEFKKDQANALAAQDFTINPFWVTLDGMQVKIQTRQFTTTGTSITVTAATPTTEYSCTEYQAN